MCSKISCFFFSFLFAMCALRSMKISSHENTLRTCCNRGAIFSLKEYVVHQFVAYRQSKSCTSRFIRMQLVIVVCNAGALCYESSSSASSKCSLCFRWLKQ